MPLLNIVVVLIVIGVDLYLINRFIPKGLQHQNDSERRDRGRRLRLVIANRRNVDDGNQFPPDAMIIALRVMMNWQVHEYDWAVDLPRGIS